jgi:hypothetical protein
MKRYTNDSNKIKELFKLDINGFKIARNALLYPYAHGDQFPKFIKVQEDGTAFVFRFFKYYDKRTNYILSFVAKDGITTDKLTLDAPATFNLNKFIEEMTKLSEIYTEVKTA